MANDIQAKGAALTQILRTDIPGNRVREGDVIEATFIKRASREAYFDIGKVGTGIVYGLEAMNARELLRNLTPGDKLPAKIIDLDGRDGYAELSLAEAGKQKLWQQVQDLMDSGEIVKIKIAAANAGGLTGNLFDLKAFLPTSQLSNDHQPKSTEGDRQRTIDELKKFIGE